MRRPAALAAAGALALVTGALVPAATAVEPSRSPAAGSAAPVAAVSQARPRTEQWWYDAMQLGALHDKGFTGKGVTVAVFDSYLDPTVPDLKGADITIKPGCDGTKTPAVSDMRADHGTAMATALVGQGTGNAEGGRGVLGVVPDAKLNFYSMEKEPDEPGEVPDLDCDPYFVEPMLARAAKDGADVISFSLGGPFILMDDGLQEMWDQGTILVAASGPSRFGPVMDNPGATPGVVAVHAANREARLWSKNPRPTPGTDSWPTLVAPGLEVEIGGISRTTQQWQSGAVRSGTSSATAIAAGALALMKSAWPEATGNQLVQTALHWPGRSEDDGAGEMTYNDKSAYGFISPATNIEVDPAGYPDENPLLMDPEQAIEKYPASVYRDPADSEEEPERDAAEEPEASAEGPEASAGEAGSDSSEEGSGSPALPIALGGGAGLLLLGGVAVLARRRAATGGLHDRTDDERGGQ